MSLGTTISTLLASPSRRSSIAAAAITVVLPAPTSWKRPTACSWRMRQTAAFWWGSQCEGGVQPRQRQVGAVVGTPAHGVEIVVVEAGQTLSAIGVAP